MGPDTGMRFGLDVGTTGPFADPRTLAELAREAEAAGWDGFFIWDILLSGDPAEPAVPVADPWIALAAIAAATSSIRIGAMVTPLPRRRPWQVAREAVTLDVLSSGRLTLGAGIGWREEEHRMIGEDPDPRVRAEQLDEALSVLDVLWRGEPVRFAGKHYRIDGLTLLPRPVQRPRIPVWLAAGWPRKRPLVRAARWDGVYLMTLDQSTQAMLTPDDVRRVAEVVREHRPTATPFDIAVSVRTPDGGDRADHAWSLAEAGATWWIEPSADTPDAYRERIRVGPPAPRRPRRPGVP